MRQIFGDIGWEKKAMVFFSLVILMAVIGPFGTYDELTLYERLVFWVMITCGVGFFMHVLMTLALGSPRLGNLSRPIRLALGSAFAALPGAAIVVFVNQVFRPSGVHAETLPSIWMQVFIIGLVIGLVEYIDWRQAVMPKAAPVVTPFHRHLPDDIGTDIISFSMQDHYAEVTTTQGKHLVLIRLGDAMVELAGLDGLQVHRSHWVACQHLTSVRQDGPKAYAGLSDGRELPVSHSFLDRVIGAAG